MFGTGFWMMISDEEQDLFETTKAEAVDAISTLASAEHNPALTYAAMMSVLLETITSEGFWNDEPPTFSDIRGFGNVMWKLTQKAFTNIAADGPVPIPSGTI